MISNHSLRYPLSRIKGIGNSISSIIIEERKKSKYLDIFDFVKRIYGKNINEKILQILNHAGCLKSLGINEKTFDLNIDLIVNYGEIGSLLDDDSLKPVLNEVPEYSSKELMKNEFEVFGFYLSKHPVTEYKIKYNTVNLTDINNYFDKNIEIIVCIDKIKTIQTKSNEEMCFITGSDEIINIDIVLFPKIYEMYKNIKLNDILKINGKVERRFDQYQIVVNKLEIIE